jgi:hypothetical protein
VSVKILALQIDSLNLFNIDISVLAFIVSTGKVLAPLHGLTVLIIILDDTGALCKADLLIPGFLDTLGRSNDWFVFIN